MASPTAPEPWRVHFQSLQGDFREADRRHPPLMAEAVIGPMPAARSEQEMLRVCQARVSQGRFVAVYTFQWSKDEFFHCSLTVAKDTEPTREDEAAEQRLRSLRSIANTFLAELSDGILSQILPSRNRRPIPGRVPLPPGEVQDDWLEVLFHLAWNHPSTALEAMRHTWLQRQAAVPLPGGQTARFPQQIFAGPGDTSAFEAQGFVRPFPHSVFSRLEYDVWRSSEAAIDALLQLAPASPKKGAATGARVYYITLNQAAALVGRSKRTLERYKDRMPAPTVEGGGGKPAEWMWSELRPWLEKEFGRLLPEVPPFAVGR